MTEDQQSTQEAAQEMVEVPEKDTSNMRWYVIQAFSGYEKKGQGIVAGSYQA